MNRSFSHKPIKNTDDFVNDLFSIINSGFPQSSIWHAKMRLLDYLGVTFTGAKMLEGKSNRLLESIGDSREEASVIGLNYKTSILNAVLINGINAHVAELDDGERFAMMHPGAPIISVLLPLVEAKNLTGNDLLKGIIIGYEAAIRVARAIQPAIKERGYHATGVCGTLGAAAGAAAALGFSKTQMKDAISAAATGAAGILEVIDEGSQLKPYNAGHAALSGLIAAFMAQSGFVGPGNVLTGKRGFIPVLTNKYKLEKLNRLAGDYLRVENAYVKPYAACRHSHPAVEATLNILQETDVKPHDIASVKVDTYYWAVGGHEHTTIQGVSSAKMSTPYSVAVALVTAKAGLSEFVEEMLNNREVTELTQKVLVVSDDALTALFPEKRAAIVQINLTNGKSYKSRVDIPKGEPENPLSEKELLEKFTELATHGGKTFDDVHEIHNLVMHIENNLGRLLKHL